MSLTPQLEHIYGLVNKLKTRYEQSIADRNKLRAQNAKLKIELSALAQKVELLESYKKANMISGSFNANEEERRVMKKTINQYIREIDNCIGILSE